ncbi:hypothetical protein pipiens_015504 [Culex pipiens pipiens]|uniref:Odorant receptor n=1 Tax=Culex pipiens pipiens TaxID=38569 RepID=A0ABD1CQ73_CULPP
MAVMPFTLQCLRLFGLRGDRRNRVHFVLALLFRLLILHLPKLVFGFRDRIDLVIRSISELLFQIHIDLRAVLFGAKLGEFEELVGLLRKAYNKVKTLDANSPERKIIEASNLAIDRRSKSYALYVAIAVTVFFWVPVIQTTAIWLVNRGSNSTDRAEFVTMMELEFYGMDHRQNIVHYFVYATFSGVAHHYAAVYFALPGMVIFSCIKSIAALFELVSTRLATLHELSGKELREELADLVELHVDGLRFVKINLTVADSIYRSEWIQMPVDVQKGLAMMLQRAQKRQGLTAAKFFYMDVERFGRVAQTSYSIFVVLKERI